MKVKQLEKLGYVIHASPGLWAVYFYPPHARRSAFMDNHLVIKGTYISPDPMISNKRRKWYSREEARKVAIAHFVKTRVSQ
jgi:hypothetical protein